MNTDDMIFVFGSNTGGIHGSGAARLAYKHRGARLGVGWGLSGQSYAIPTKGIIKQGGKTYVGETLHLNVIKRYVHDFLMYAKVRPDIQFQVTRLGCGLAGLRDDEIATMFIGGQSNLFYDDMWKDYLTDDSQFWGTF